MQNETVDKLMQKLVIHQADAEIKCDSSKCPYNESGECKRECDNS